MNQQTSNTSTAELAEIADNWFFSAFSASSAVFVLFFRVAISTATVMAVLSRAPAAAQTAPAAAKAGTVQAAKSWTPPRAPWGEPDLQGTYSNKTITPFE